MDSEKFFDVWKPNNSGKLKLFVRRSNCFEKSINKLQRFRVQIREWLGSSDVIKMRDKLEEARKSIEGNMHKFKDFERHLKTKAYSTFALAKDEEEEDVMTAEAREHHNWLMEQITLLNDQIDGYEADMEARLANNAKADCSELKGWVEKHRWHIEKLEQLLRALANDKVLRTLCTIGSFPF